MEPCGPSRLAPGALRIAASTKEWARLAERKKDLKPEQLNGIREALAREASC